MATTERDEEQVDRDQWHQEQADEERSQAELDDAQERRGDYFETAKALTFASVHSELMLWQACRGVK
jgi:hypothetical protein